MVVSIKPGEDQMDFTPNGGSTGPVEGNSMVQVEEDANDAGTRDGGTTGSVEGNSMVKVEEDANDTGTSDGGTTDPVEGNSMVKVEEDANDTGTRDAFEFRENDECSLLISVKPFPVTDCVQMGAIEFPSEEEKLTKQAQRKQISPPDSIKINNDGTMSQGGIQTHLEKSPAEIPIKEKSSTNQGLDHLKGTQEQISCSALKRGHDPPKSTSRTKVQDRPNPDKVKGLSSRSVPPRRKQMPKPLRRKQIPLTFTLRDTGSGMYAGMVLLICICFLPVILAKLEVRTKDLGYKGIADNESMQVTDRIGIPEDGSHYAVHISQGYEEFVCNKMNAEEHRNCELAVGRTESCHGLQLVNDHGHVHVSLDGASVKDRVSICILQQVPNNFTLYKLDVFKKKAPITCPALDTDPLATQTGCVPDSQGQVALGSVCNFSCPSGYEGKGDVHKMCLDSGTWTSTNFTCQGTHTCTPVSGWKVSTITLAITLTVIVICIFTGICLFIYLFIYHKTILINFFRKWIGRPNSEYDQARQDGGQARDSETPTQDADQTMVSMLDYNMIATGPNNAELNDQRMEGQNGHAHVDGGGKGG